MKKRLLIFLGVLCSFGFYSCNKYSFEDIFDHGQKPDTESTFFDPTGLVSPSQHGVLDTIQKGFSFTEGPAVDKH